MIINQVLSKLIILRDNFEQKLILLKKWKESTVPLSGEIITGLPEDNKKQVYLDALSYRIISTYDVLLKILQQVESLNTKGVISDTKEKVINSDNQSKLKFIRNELSHWITEKDREQLIRNINSQFYKICNSSLEKINDIIKQLSV